MKENLPRKKKKKQKALFDKLLKHIALVAYTSVCVSRTLKDIESSMNSLLIPFHRNNPITRFDRLLETSNN